MQLRTRALETILLEKGYIEPAAIDDLIETYEKKIGPRNGAQVVAKAWVDPQIPPMAVRGRHRGGRLARLRRALRQSPGGAGEHAVGAQHGRLHAVLLLPVGRARPAAALVQVGALPLAHRRRSARRAAPTSASSLPKDTEIRVWDSTAELRYLVVPMRPAGTEGWSEDKLAELVTRDSMIGTGLREIAEGPHMNGAADMGGMHGFGPVVPEDERAGRSTPTGKAIPSRSTW